MKSQYEREKCGFLKPLSWEAIWKMSEIRLLYNFSCTFVHEYLECSSSIYNNKGPLSLALQKVRSPPSWALLHLISTSVICNASQDISTYSLVLIFATSTSIFKGKHSCKMMLIDRCRAWFSYITWFRRIIPVTVLSLRIWSSISALTSL